MNNERFISAIKRALRPIAKHRHIPEKLRYSRSTIHSAEEGNGLLAELLQSRKACAVGKMGASELRGLRHYLRNKDEQGLCRSWGKYERLLHVNAGVYPCTSAAFSGFCNSYADALSSLDVLAVWFNPGEFAARREYCPTAALTTISALEPFYHPDPWSRHLAGRRVLVISPFVGTIQRQYARRREVWRAKPDVLPDFDLVTIRSPLSAGLVAPLYPTWHDALRVMQEQMDALRYDVAVVGSGAWSISLVAHAKRRGAFAIHLGGPTQILFGIMGGRWDDNSRIRPLVNGAWCRPSEEETPKTSRKVENACYW